MNWRNLGKALAACLAPKGNWMRQYPLNLRNDPYKLKKFWVYPCPPQSFESSFLQAKPGSVVWGLLWVDPLRTYLSQ
jgi:hypothetical protein